MNYTERNDDEIEDILKYFVRYISDYIDHNDIDDKFYGNQKEIIIYIPKYDIRCIIKSEDVSDDDGNSLWMMYVRSNELKDFYIEFDWYREEIYDYKISEKLFKKHLFLKI